MLSRIAVSPKKVNNAVESSNYRFVVEGDHIIIKNSAGKTIVANGPLARVGRKPSMAEVATTSSRRSKTEHTLWNPFILSSTKATVTDFTPEKVVINYVYSPESPEDKSLSGDVVYTFDKNGAIQVEYLFKPEKANEDALETGLSFVIPSTMTEFRWIGKGPYESYPDKSKMNEFGFHHLHSEDLYFPGNRQEVECAVFTDSNGDGFAIIADKANIAVERTEEGLVVSHNQEVMGKFNKYTWPDQMIALTKDNEIKGRFTIIPLSADWPRIFTDLFGPSTKTATPFKPFFHSYDQ